MLINHLLSLYRQADVPAPCCTACGVRAPPCMIYGITDHPCTAYGVLVGLKAASLLAHVQYTVHFTANCACSLFVGPTCSLIPVRQPTVFPLARVYPRAHYCSSYGVRHTASRFPCVHLTTLLASQQPTASTLARGQLTASKAHQLHPAAYPLFYG